MTTTTTGRTNIWAALGTVFLVAASYAQEPVLEICAGTDAVAGTVNSIVESGSRVFVLTSNSGDHPSGGGLYISCDEGDAWQKHESISEGGASIEVDPSDANTIYAGIGGGMVYVSRNLGETWESRQPADIGNIPVTALAARPGGQIWAGTETGGLLQSEDYGESWVAPDGLLPAESIHTIIADPANANRLLVAVGNHGIYQTLDGGQTFSQSMLAGTVIPPVYWDVRDISFAPADTSQVVAGSSTGLWQSADGGSVFTTAAAANNVVDITIGRHDTDTIFIVSDYEGLMRSADNGLSITLQKPDLPRSTNWFGRALQLQSGRLLIGTVLEGLYKSDDDGTTWQIAGNEPPLPPEPTPPPQPPGSPPPPSMTAKLSVSVENLNGSGVIEAGSEARFRLLIRNEGPDTSTDTYVRFGWALPGTTSISSKAFELSSSIGTCAVGPNVESACAIGRLDFGQTVTIEFRGTTTTDFIGIHKINATASNAEGAYSNGTGSVGTSKSIACFGDCGANAEGGGGSTSFLLIAALLTVLRRRCQSS